MGRILPRTTPESVGIPSAAMSALLDDFESNRRGIHSLMIVRHGSVAAEGWWAPNGPEDGQMLFSLSKAFTSTAVGMAIAEGRFRIDDTVISFFPDETPAEVSPNLAAMTVRHLLTMSAGHSPATAGAVMRFSGDDWVRSFLALPVADPPGSRFVYSSAASYILSAIIQKTTGQKLVDYLRPRLFEPLGIPRPTWEEDPRGINVGGYGLSVRTEDVAAFGQLYLQEGRWKGKTLVDPSWVAEATSLQIPTGPDPNSDWAQGYGYQFWQSRHGYRCDGAFGQYCVVVPEQDLVVAITSGSDRMHGILEALWNALLPGLVAGELPPDPAAQRAVTLRLGSLRLETPPGDASSPAESALHGAECRFDPNALGVRSVRFDFDPSGGSLEFEWESRPAVRRLSFGRATWRKGRSNLAPEWRGAPLAACGAWPRPEQLDVDVCLYATPFRQRLSFEFDAGASSLRLTTRATPPSAQAGMGVLTASRLPTRRP